MLLRLAFPARFREEVDGQEDEPLVGAVVFEQPEAFFGVAESVVCEALREAELGELQISPRRRQVLGAQGDAGRHVAIALGEEIDDGLQPVVVTGEQAFLLARTLPRGSLSHASDANRRYSPVPVSPSRSA